MNFIESVSYRIKSRLNKGLLNKLFVFVGLEKYIQVSNSYWRNYVVASDKTDQEIAGFSHIASIDAAVASVHKQLQECRKKHFHDDSIRVLDIGCGPGLYLKDFPANLTKYGVDLSHDMLKLAGKNNPGANLVEGSFLKVKFPVTFNIIYSVGVLQCFAPTELQELFKKSHSLLEPGGVLFLSYPHAISEKDLSYPDINYIQYSPQYLRSSASRYFNVLSNTHVTQNRTVEDYDRTPATPPKNFDRTYENSSILIAQKKK